MRARFVGTRRTGLPTDFNCICENRELRSVLVGFSTGKCRRLWFSRLIKGKGAFANFREPTKRARTATSLVLRSVAELYFLQGAVRGISIPRIGCYLTSLALASKVTRPSPHISSKVLPLGVSVIVTPPIMIGPPSARLLQAACTLRVTILFLSFSL